MRKLMTRDEVANWLPKEEVQDMERLIGRQLSDYEADRMRNNEYLYMTCKRLDWDVKQFPRLPD